MTTSAETGYIAIGAMAGAGVMGIAVHFILRYREKRARAPKHQGEELQTVPGPSGSHPHSHAHQKSKEEV